MSMDCSQQQHKQALRLRRSLMGLGAYACTMVLVLASYLTGLMPGWVAALYLGVVLVTNGVFLAFILSGLNLRLPRPDMTLEQIICSIIPGLFALYFITSPQARAGFLLLGLVPMIFGFLGLSTRRSLLAGAIIYAGFAAIFALLFVFEPQRVDPAGDGILMVSFFVATLQVSLMGGYVSGLHRTLSSVNQRLKEAVATIAELANRDELTGIFNRRYLLKVVEDEAERSNRGQQHFSLAILDIDNFKEVNDNFGHDVGDDSDCANHRGQRAQARSLRQVWGRGVSVGYAANRAGGCVA